MKSLIHTVNQSPFTHPALNQCLRYFQQGDAIILFDNGTYAALCSQPLSQQLQTKPCFAIEADLASRGLFQQDLISSIRFVDYPEFVELTAKYDLVQSWY